MSTETRISGRGEFGLIDRIAAHVGSAESVVTGIRDDAAVTAPSSGMQLLTSTDMLLEEVHFRRSWHDPYRLGRKSLAVSISDIAAMGAIPRWALQSLALPAELPLAFLDEFTRGFLAMAAEHGITLIGGDTCASRSGLVISVTIMGEQHPERVIRRSGARPGDEIWVTGTLGDAALALTLLENNSCSCHGEGDNAYLVSRLLDPTPLSVAGQALADSGLVSAMIDVSDGLLADFGHISEMSGVGGVLHLDRLPISATFRRTASRFPAFPYHLVLSGGEDYELAFTASPGNHEKIADLMKNCGIEATPVGIVTNSSQVLVIQPDGNGYDQQVTGFTHFK